MSNLTQYRGYRHFESDGCLFRKAFTLVEMLVLIAILAIMIGLIVPAVQKVRAAAARADCASRMRQLALGVHQYEAVNQKLPQGCRYPLAVVRNVSPGFSWQSSILPFIDQSPLWERIDEVHRADKTGEADTRHLEIRGTILPVFLCPSDGVDSTTRSDGWRVAMTNYAGVAGSGWPIDDGIFHPRLTVRFTDVTDGSANTLMIAERVPGPNGHRGGWYAHWGATGTCPVSQLVSTGRFQPLPEYAVGCSANRASFGPADRNSGCTLGRFGSFHHGGANFAFVDGSVRFVPYSAVEIIPALVTRAGGESETLEQ